MTSSEQSRNYPSGFLGHTQAAQEIERCIRHNNLPHGLLLQGPKGIGKYRFACCLAKRLFLSDTCSLEKPTDHHNLSPKDTQIISLLQSGAYGNLKIISLDHNPHLTKKNISIDEVNAAITFLSLTSLDNNWRVLIIDSIDDLTPKGANAFLKLLEEPPSKTLIILISHRPECVLPTLRSRCRIIPLQCLTAAETRQVLTNEFNLDETSLDDLVDYVRGRPGLAHDLIQLGGTNSLRDLKTGLQKALTGDYSTVVKLVDDLFNASTFEHDEDTFRALANMIVHEFALTILTPSQLTHPPHIQSIDRWFKTMRDIQDAQIYSLDKKAACVSIIHQLACTH